MMRVLRGWRRVLLVAVPLLVAVVARGVFSAIVGAPGPAVVEVAAAVVVVEAAVARAVVAPPLGRAVVLHRGRLAAFAAGGGAAGVAAVLQAVVLLLPEGEARLPLVADDADGLREQLLRVLGLLQQRLLPHQRLLLLLRGPRAGRGLSGAGPAGFWVDAVELPVLRSTQVS